MASTTEQAKLEPVGTALLEQLAEIDARTMSAETARDLLKLSFASSHQQRVHILSVKAQKGSLTPGEQVELDEYIHVGDLLAIIHSKARQALKHAGQPS